MVLNYLLSIRDQFDFYLFLILIILSWLFNAIRTKKWARKIYLVEFWHAKLSFLFVMCIHSKFIYLRRARRTWEEFLVFQKFPHLWSAPNSSEQNSNDSYDYWGEKWKRDIGNANIFIWDKVAKINWNSLQKDAQKCLCLAFQAIELILPKFSICIQFAQLAAKYGHLNETLNWMLKMALLVFDICPISVAQQMTYSKATLSFVHSTESNVHLN